MELRRVMPSKEKMKKHSIRIACVCACVLLNVNAYVRAQVINESFEEDTLTILNTKAMKDMMRVIKDVEDVKRSILDIKRSDAAERLALERERLEIEKERLALERERNALRNGNIGSEDNMRYGVVLIPEVIDNE